MKFQLKIFLITFIACSVLIGAGMAAYNTFFYNSLDKLMEDAPVVIGYDANANDADKTELERIMATSSRINILLFGTDGGRSDTIMVLSYDPKNKLADIISIPRDTYNEIPGYNHPAMRKINAVLGLKKEGGPEGLKKTVSKILKIPIAYYAQIEYDGIKRIVDSVGGVELEVPFKMNYDDDRATPPLHIHLEAGMQTLDGDKSIQFLRWRKNNGEGGLGDIPRSGRQQEFMKAVAKKALSLKLPAFLKTSFENVETDMSLNKILLFGTTTAGMDMANMKTYTLPGAPAGSKYGYYEHDPVKTEELMKEIYARTPSTEAVPGEPSTEAPPTN